MRYKINTTMPRSVSGFTLIELLVVISIIGLLSSIILSNLNTIRAKARDADRIQSLKEISKALEFYYDDNGHYPIGAKFTVNNNNNYGTLLNTGTFYEYSYTGLNKLAVKLNKYIPKLPADPNGGKSSPPNDYIYLTKGTGYAYWTNSTGSKYQLMERFEKNNPLDCKNKQYMSTFPYPYGSADVSLCGKGSSYAEYWFTFNQKLYVISSGQ